jgi:hypothetical protein
MAASSLYFNGMPSGVDPRSYTASASGGYTTDMGAFMLDTIA